MRADRAAFGAVEDAVRLSRYGGDCYAYCMLAAGHVDLVIETELKPYDVLPLIPIIAGAGGVVTTWENGSPYRRRPHRRRRRQARACGGDGAARTQATALYPNIGVPGTNASNAARTCIAEAVLLHQHFVPRARHDQMRAGAQPDREFSIAGVETIWSWPAATIRIGWRILAG